MYGVFVRILTERSQRKAFLQARSCIEDRLRLEDENEKQVSVSSVKWSFGHLCLSPSYARFQYYLMKGSCDCRVPTSSCWEPQSTL